MITQNLNWKDYCDKIAKPKVWGDEIVIKSVCEVFGVRILLFSSTIDEKHYLSEHFPKNKENSSIPILRICHFLEYHYTSLVNQDQKKSKNYF